jgi:hypothetical protein
MSQPQPADLRLYLVVHETLRRILARFVTATERLDPPVLAEVIPERWALDLAVLSLEGDPSDSTKQVLHDAIAAVRDQLVPHLDVEDERLLPAAARTVHPKEWDRASEEALKATPRADMPVVAGALDETVRSLPPDQRPPPPPVALRVMLAISWRRRYQQYTAALDG